MLTALKIPPGVYRNGTKYQTKGRWYDASLVRCFEGTIRPVGGWQELEATGQNSEITASIFDDAFSGAVDTALTAHTPDFPAAFSWTDADAAFELDGSGALRPAVTDGNVHRAYVADEIGTPAAGQDFWFEMTLPAVASGFASASQGLIFLRSSADSEEYWMRLFPTPHAGNTGWDFFNGILMNSRSSAGADEPTRSNTLSATPNLPAGSYRFGVNIVSGTQYDVWWEPAGGGSRTILASWTGNSAALVSRLDATHSKMGLIAEMEVGSDTKINYTRVRTEVVTATNGTEITLEGVPRAMVGWRGDDGNQTLAVGTNEKLYGHVTGILYDLTPSGFVPGSVDSSQTAPGGGSAGNYGDGDYGEGPFGTGNPAQEAITPAAVWHLDTFGEYLVGCCAPNDGDLYYWTRDVEEAAQQMPGAPTECKGIVVTPERFVFALGAGGASRRVEWADQESLTAWTPASTNQAGGIDLEGVGTLVAGRRSKGETLLWTDDDMHAARYIGGTLIYSFEKVGSKCGLIAPGAVALVDTKAIWMGNRQFHLYDGYVRSLPCEVSDLVFSDFNYDQRQKVTAMTLSPFGEIWWFYPSLASTENDRYVVWNYRENHWMIGALPRTAGCDSGALAYPMAAGPNGKIYEHERGSDHLDFDAAVVRPYIESGPVEIGDGDRVSAVTQLVPDEKTHGDAQFYLYASMYPGESEVSHGPFSIRTLTDSRVTGRWVRLRVEEVNAVSWRLGSLRLDLREAGRR